MSDREHATKNSGEASAGGGTEEESHEDPRVRAHMRKEALRRRAAKEGGAGQDQAEQDSSKGNKEKPAADQQKQQPKVTLLIGSAYNKNGKDMPYGHVALRILDEHGDFTYDYGRYGKTWGLGGSEGEGQLRVWTDFSKYIAEENATGRTTTSYSFPSTAQAVEKIHAYFNQKIAGVKPNQDRGHMKQYRLDEDYSALVSNCTTMSVDGAKQALPQVDAKASQFEDGRGLSFTEKAAAKMKGWPDRTFMPGDLKAELDGMSGADKPTVETYHEK